MGFNQNNEENDDITREDRRSDIVSLNIFGSDNSTTDLVVHIPHYVNKTKGVAMNHKNTALLLSKCFPSLYHKI
jgi:hypothetical protein